MKCNVRINAGVKLLALCFVSLCLLHAPLSAAETELFNGRDLTGWVNVNGAPDTWQVRDAAIVCTGEPRCFLRTDRMYENYVLELECLHVKPGGNSGLFFHADALPQIGAPYPRAIEAQLLDDDHGSLFGIRGASLVPLTDPDKKGTTARARPLEKRCKPAGNWNKYVLTTKDGNVELAVNGKVVTRAKQTSLVKGFIGLQAEHTEVHFRNIRIRELPSSNPPAEKVAQPDAGFVSLFDGLTFSGWNHRPGHKGHWVAHDGEIHYDGKAESKKRADRDLWTKDEFEDFVLIVDWRLSAEPEMKPHPIVLFNGDFLMEADNPRQRVTRPHLDAGDSGIYLRGSSKAQLNVWSQVLGSGEINGYRTDKTMPPEVRRACIPIKNADRPLGQWNRFAITMRGDRVSVVLNGTTVIEGAQLPGIHPNGPIALQHHNDPVEFRNLFIKPLK